VLLSIGMRKRGIWVAFGILAVLGVGFFCCHTEDDLAFLSRFHPKETKYERVVYAVDGPAKTRCFKFKSGSPELFTALGIPKDFQGSAAEVNIDRGRIRGWYDYMDNKLVILLPGPTWLERQWTALKRRVGAEPQPSPIPPSPTPLKRSGER